MRPATKATQFLRQEYIVIGTADDVLSTRQRVIEAFVRILTELDLTHRLVVGTGCFEIHNDDLVATLRKTRDVRSVPILDIEVWIPSRQQWLEVLGAGIWDDRLTRAFSIKSNGAFPHSGCVGVGMSRLGYAVLAQRGDVLGCFQGKV
jgi:seryl-tRNA synthetase